MNLDVGYFLLPSLALRVLDRLVHVWIKHKVIREAPFADDWMKRMNESQNSPKWLLAFCLILRTFAITSTMYPVFAESDVGGVLGQSSPRYFSSSWTIWLLVAFVMRPSSSNSGEVEHTSYWSSSSIDLSRSFAMSNNLIIWASSRPLDLTVPFFEAAGALWIEANVLRFVRWMVSESLTVFSQNLSFRSDSYATSPIFSV